MAAAGLGNELGKLGHEVHYYGNCEPSDRYHSYQEFIDTTHEVAIIVRASRILFGNVKADRTILWTGDAYDQPNNFVLNAPYAVGRLKHVVFKSQWQMKSALEHYPVLAAMGKAMVMPNGVVRNAFFEHSEPKTGFICTSRVFRGIDRLTAIWPRLYDRFNSTLDLKTKDSRRFVKDFV